MNKREQSLFLLKSSLALLHCPLCRTSLQVKAEGSLVCQNGHCYDVTKKGYVNFVPNQKATHYRTELFESRRQIFRSGFYEPVLSALSSIIEENRKKSKPFSLLDAGCGEGYYIASLKEQNKELSAFGVDLSKDAIRLACGGTAGVFYSVADLARLPFAGRSLDILLNILTPANYGEFARVLKPEGLFIKLIPGKYYLTEIRSLIQERLKNQEANDGRTAAYLLARLKDVRKTSLTYTKPVTPEEARAFLSMTPLTFGLDTEEMPTTDLKSITIDVQIYIGRLC